MNVIFLKQASSKTCNVNIFEGNVKGDAIADTVVDRITICCSYVGQIFPKKLAYKKQFSKYCHILGML
jgi:hypothetical protein